jgi:hypothetical protein
MQKAEKRCSVVAPIYGWSVALQSHDSHDGFIEVVVRMLYEGALDSSSGRLSRVDCLEGAPRNGRWNPYEIVLYPEENFSQGSLLGLPEL